MKPQRVEGIIVHTIAYGDSDQIITAFTREAGMIKLILHRSLAINGRRHLSPVSALSRVEFVYAAGRGDLHRGKEVALIDSYLRLRTSYRHLEAGCALLEAIRLSQLGERAAPLLYSLLSLYLDRLHELPVPAVAVASFHLKILKHEGLLGEEILSDWSEEEGLLLSLLAGCRRFSDLLSVQVETAFATKVKKLFSACLSG